MRLSQLANREIIVLDDGRRLGPAGEVDLVLDEHSGEIQEVMLPMRGGWWLSRRVLRVPWSSVRRVGPEVVIVELGEVPEGGDTEMPG